MLLVLSFLSIVIPYVWCRYLCPYGALLGARAVEQWRLVLANFNMFDIRNQVMLSIFTDFDESGVAPKEGKAKELTELVDVLVPIAAKLAA